MRVTTKKIPATDTRGAFIRLRALVVGNGLTVTDYPYDYAADDPHEAIIRRRFPDATSVECTGESRLGREWQVSEGRDPAAEQEIRVGQEWRILWSGRRIRITVGRGMRDEYGWEGVDHDDKGAFYGTYLRRECELVQEDAR